MNFSLAGVLKNRSRTAMVVPLGQPASSWLTTTPASTVRDVPRSASSVRVSSSTRDTAEMAARASPRKPRVPMASRSYSVAILEVAWRKKAVAAWSAGMPQPSSVTRIRDIPPWAISTVTAPAPASMAFSISSLTTLAGRSTTSPAAIRSATWGSNCFITGMIYTSSNIVTGPSFWENTCISAPNSPCSTRKPRSRH